MKWDWKNWDWKHSLASACFLAAIIDEGLVAWLKAGNPLPWHITFGVLLIAAKAIDFITHSMTGSTGAKDMMGMIAPGAPPEVRAKLSVRPPSPPPVGLAMLCLALLGCAAGGGSVPSDVLANYQCVQDGVALKLPAVEIEAKCLPGQLSTILAIIENLIASPEWRGKNPDFIGVAERARGDIKAKIAASECEKWPR